MPKYTVHVAADVRCYGRISVEAADADEAERIVEQLIENDEGPIVDPEWDTLEIPEVIAVDLEAL